MKHSFVLPALSLRIDQTILRLHEARPLGAVYPIVYLDCIVVKIRQDKVIYTTNTIESLNGVIRKATKKRQLFPTDDATKKVIYLAIQNASKKWTMRIKD